MKNLFRDHSYDMVKMFLNQFATAMFGFALVLAAEKAQNVMLRNVTSIAAILFYLFLLYTMTWEIGFRDRVGVLHGSKPNQPWKGAVISLFANSLNILLAIFVTLGSLLPKTAFASIGGVCKVIALLSEGMYMGVLANRVGNVQLNSQWFMFFVIILPAVLVCGLAYLFGLKDVKFTAGVNRQQYPESDREPKRKKDRTHED
jgi:hypothetical protein